MHALWRFLAYALEYKPLLAVALITGIAKFLLALTFPWLTGMAVDHVLAPDAAKGFDVSTDARVSWLWYVVWLGLGFSVLHALATYGRGFYSAKLGNRIIADLRQDLFEHLHQLSLHFYSKERTGSIITRLITDIQQAAQLIHGGVVSVVMDSVLLVVGLYLLLDLSWKLAVAAMVVMPLYAITFRYLNPRVKRASLAAQSQLSKISGNAQERLAGIALVKTYAAEHRERDQFVVDTEEHFDRVIHQSNLAQTVSGISDFLIHVGTTAVIGVGGYLALFSTTTPLTAGEVTKAIGYLAVMYLPVRRFAEINVLYQTSLASIERVFQVFDITPKIVEPADARREPPTEGRVSFEAVSFSYHDDVSDESRVSLEERKIGHATAPDSEQRWVLREISLEVPSGRRVAFVGPSGSGKTTLVSLIPRLYDVSEGRIAIDGVDVRQYRQRALRRAIGIVQQDSFLFSGTVRQNIAYGKPKATDEQIVLAAQAANAHEFIMQLPEGYDSIIGERGVTLSGGQRQRVSIARALLKDPRILILDEATSALDSASEALVQQALARLMQGRTCFIIAHRLSTVRSADEIVVLERGRVAERGSHEELLTRGGLYSRLVRQQFGLDPSADGTGASGALGPPAMTITP